MDAKKAQDLKVKIKALIMEMGEPDSRHVSIARTALEDAVLRLDCEMRMQGVTVQDEVTEEIGKPLTEALQPVLEEDPIDLEL